MPNSVTGLLELALPKPAHIASSDGGAVLALALHCLMVREGWNAVDDSARKKHSVYCPPAEWNGQFPDQWVFMYTKDGFANRFVVHCSLQKATKRMFIHASEQSNLHNICLLGLQLDNYVPDASKLKSNSWEGVLTNQLKLQELFTQYIARPLVSQAEELVLVSAEHQAFGQQQQIMQRRSGRCDLPDGGAWPMSPLGWQQHYAAMAVTGALMALGSVVVWRALRAQ